MNKTFNHRHVVDFMSLLELFSVVWYAIRGISFHPVLILIEVHSQWAWLGGVCDHITQFPSHLTLNITSSEA